MSRPFRVLTGRNIRPDLTGASADTAYPSWTEARDQLVIEVREQLADAGSPGGCPHCLIASQAALDGLLVLADGEPFYADIDGCDYVLFGPNPDGDL